MASALASNFAANASIVLLSGIARDWHYPGSTTTGIANGGGASMVRTLAFELAPVRVNAVHPVGVIDSPSFAPLPAAAVDRIRRLTASGSLVTMRQSILARFFRQASGKPINCSVISLPSLANLGENQSSSPCGGNVGKREAFSTFTSGGS